MQRYINLLSTLIVDNDARVRLEERTTQVGVGEGRGTPLLQCADTLLRFLRLNPSADLKVVEEAPAPDEADVARLMELGFPKESCKAALLAAGGDVRAATEALLQAY
eukprot:COSAG04_NODE_10266_length_791_cov_0.960983_2_plen_107_part_00